VNGTDIANNGGSNTWRIPAGTILSNFNTYGVLWTPTAISWYFNNTLVETVSTTTAPYNTQFAGQYPAFLSFIESAGCNFTLYQVQPCEGQVSPLNMQVQWVHVYNSH
jgi:beta-glucanase (GH16 family)